MPKPYPLKCGNCGKLYLRWQGFCQCGATDSILSITKETIESKRIRSRAKRSEQKIARRMQTVDGVDPAFTNVTSSISRVGHITGMRIDALTASYVIENKNRVLPKWVIQAWILINQRAVDFNKRALLHIEPANMPRDYTVNAVKYKLDTMALITQTHHESLITSEQQLAKVKQIIEGTDTNLIKVRRVAEILGS